MYRGFLKRLIDVILSGIGLIISSPIFIVIGFLVLIDSGWPIIYFNDRVTIGGRRFQMAKFRSMHQEYSTGGRFSGLKDEDYVKTVLKDPKMIEFFDRFKKIPNDPRVTRIGRLIRKTSLDELPQLLNVLIGDMSLVGPRAYKVYEVTEKSDSSLEFKKLFEEILSVRPGITGPWQTGGRSKIPFEDRIRLEAQYAERLSFWYDLSLILKTPFKVIQREGAA